MVQIHGVMEPNPLTDYFRAPGLHITLPTDGAFMPEGSIEFTMNNDIPVYPMTAKDEMILKSPDALMSGLALESLIRSCVPAIKAPRLVSQPDLDVIMVAIRAASYGEVISIPATCPNCKTENEYDCHLSDLISQMTFIEPENTIRLSDDLMVYLQPNTMFQANRVAMVVYEETRNNQAITDETSQEERSRIINRGVERLTQLNIDTVAECIIKVVTPKGEVTNKIYITEFVNQLPNTLVKKISDLLAEINNKGLPKNIPVVCNGIKTEDGKEIPCNHQFEAHLEFNPTSFFDQGSSE